MNKITTTASPVSTLGNQIATSTVTTKAIPQSTQVPNASGKNVASTNMSMGMTTNSNASGNYDMKMSNMSMSQQGNCLFSLNSFSFFLIKCYKSETYINNTHTFII